MSCKSYSERKLKALKEVDELISLALAKFSNYAGGTYVGDLREFKDLVGVKIKLEQIQKRVSKGYAWEKDRYERSSTRAFTKE